MSDPRMLPKRVDLVFTKTGEVVEDLEKLCRGVIGSEGWPGRILSAADERELLATLLSDAVMLEAYYQPRAGIEARPWLFQRLRWKARNWRDLFYFGRGGQHRTVGDLGAPDGLVDDGDGERLDHRSGLGSGAHGSPGEVAGDRGDPGLDVLRGLLESGDRALLREIEALGLSAPPGARGRSPAADRALRRLDRKRRERIAELERREDAVAA